MINNSRFFNKNNLFILLLIILTVVIHHQWFTFDTVLTNGDWGYRSNELTKEFNTSFLLWRNNSHYGFVNIQIYFNIFTILWSFFAKLGFSYDTAVKFTLLVPISLFGFLSPYILSKKLSNDSFISFVSACFYGTTTYFLIKQINGHLPIAFVYSIAPYIFYLFIESFERNTNNQWMKFILVSTFAVCYEVRIMTLVFFILLLYFLFFYIKDIEKYLKKIIISILLFILLNTFWILPTFFSGGVTSQILDATSRSLFGSWLFTLNNAFTLSEASWTGKEVSDFILQPIPLYLWLIPIISFSTLLLNLRYFRNKKKLYFFTLLSLIGIFLTKQEGRPFAEVYKWLYEHIPPFSLYREASKFYILTSLGYMGMITYLLLILKKHKYKLVNRYLFFVVSIIILIISLFNSKSLISGDAGRMFLTKNIHNDYQILKSFVLNQNEYFRILSIPNPSRWMIYTSNHPKLNLDDYFSKMNNSFYASASMEEISDLILSENTNKFSDISAVKYIVVPIEDIVNDPYLFPKRMEDQTVGSREWFIAKLDNTKWLNKININTQSLIIYENLDYHPHIIITENKLSFDNDIKVNRVDFEYINPTEYLIKLKNIDKPIYLNFSEDYHPQWKIGDISFKWFKVFTDKSIFLNDSFHYKNYYGLNSFYIDPEDLCSKFICSKSKDGGYDIDLVLFFKPQSYMNLGLIISIWTLSSIIFYKLYFFVKGRNFK